ncbi:flavoprotein [Amycolatopsis sp. cg5]|uniref:flavoprotein n=1 Tax=Amycolatopsis sp. cg5 TaxID=3238802 RepID=UPI003525DF3F
MSRVLGLIGSSCGGLDTRFAAELAKPAAALGWRLAITLTPTAYRWLEVTDGLGELQALTDLPVRSVSRLPGEARPHPDPEVFLFAPATANSVAKLALGIADNQALTVVGDVLGSPRVTIALAYSIQDTRALHPAWQGHLDTLAGAGVRLRRLGRDWSDALALLPEA